MRWSEKLNRLRPELELDQIVVSLNQIGQKFDRIAAECENTCAWENRFRAWGKN